MKDPPLGRILARKPRCTFDVYAKETEGRQCETNGFASFTRKRTKLRYQGNLFSLERRVENHTFECLYENFLETLRRVFIALLSRWTV